MLLKLCATQHHLILEIVYYAAHVYRVFMLLVRPHLAGLPYSACVHIQYAVQMKGKSFDVGSKHSLGNTSLSYLCFGCCYVINVQN